MLSTTVSFLLCVASLYLSEVQAINYNQCTWNNYVAQQVGTVQTCTISKQSASSALKVTYAATMSVLCPGTLCCGKWYFTFNGNECTSPDTIEGIVHVNDNKNNPMSTSRHRQITGICENLPEGNVDVAVRVGNCPYYGTTSKHSGWATVSRIIIEEY